MKLRPYQQETLHSIKAHLSAGTNRQLVKLPTGTGKTVVFASLPDFLGFSKRVMVLVHRDELVKQAVDKLIHLNPTRSVGVEMADKEAGNSDLVVASVATLGRKGNSRLKRFVKEDFDGIVIDECHHAASTTYLHVIDHFNVNEDRDRLLLGVTATPNRTDGRGLGQVFQQIVFDMTLLEGINQGWLVDLIGIRVRTNNSLDEVNTVGGDFDLGELTGAVNTPARNDLIVRAWLEHAQTRQTLVFTVDVQHAKDLAMTFKRYEVAAEAIWGNDVRREEKARDHRNGKIRVLINCQLLTEGYDDWKIGCVILARPTKSEILYTQVIGRGTRIPSDLNNLLEARYLGLPIAKDNCIILDVVDVTSKHSLISLPSLFGLDVGLDFRGKRVAAVVKEVNELAESRPYIDRTQISDVRKIKSWAESADLFRMTFTPEIVQYSEFQWHKTGIDSYVLILPGRDQLKIRRDLLENWLCEGRIRDKVVNFAEKSFGSAIRKADSDVRELAGKTSLKLVQRPTGWHKDPPTKAQLSICEKHKIPVLPGATNGDVARQIAQLFAAWKTKREARMAIKLPKDDGKSSM